MTTFNDHLRWRYAVKKFDPAKKIAPKQLSDLLESARLAPSSYGLQPYRLFVITNPQLRTRIRAAAYDQPQVTDASHLVIFCARTMVDDAFIDDYMQTTADTRGVTLDSLAAYRERIAGSVNKRSPAEQTVWTQKQAYISLGMLLAACAQAQVDACPMEGFDAAAVDQILSLSALHLTATVFCPIGFRAVDDSMAARKKVRVPLENFVIQRQ